MQYQIYSSLWDTRDIGSIPGSGWSPEEAWQSTPVFLPRESHRQRSLASWSLWGCKELDKTERLTLSLFSACTIQLCALNQEQVARKFQNPSQTQKAMTVISWTMVYLSIYLFCLQFLSLMSLSFQSTGLSPPWLNLFLGTLTIEHWFW